MGATLAKNRGGVSVHTLHPVPSGGTVFYGSLPGDSETCKELLIAALWDHLQTTATPLDHCRPSSRAACSLQLLYGPLGRPYTRMGEHRGPAISFSRGGGRVWAALSGDESAVGIDLAESAEFEGAYPLQRVFHPEELHHAVKVTAGDREEAAALLWSVKEAVVKALGCGFHLMDPRQISVHQSAGGEGGYAFPVSLTGKDLERLPLAAGQFLWVYSFPQKKMWLSIAVTKCLQVYHA